MTETNLPTPQVAPTEGASPVTRRNFLRDLGVAGGAAVMLGAMQTLGCAADPIKLPFIPPSGGDLGGRKPKVIILGAGVAGLCAAYELEKAGYSVEIIEARNRPGGRNWTARRNTSETDLDGVTQVCNFSRGVYMNMGPARIPQHHTTMDYCRELGVQLEAFVNQNAQAYYYNEAVGAVSGALTSTKVRHREAKSDFFGYTSELLAKATDQGLLDQELSAADKEALIAYLRSFGGLSNQNAYNGGARRGFPRDDRPTSGFQNGTANPPFDRSELLASRLGNYFAFEQGWDQAMMMFQPVGGMDAIPMAFAGAIKGPIRYNRPVINIQNTGSGVAVTFVQGGTSRTSTADYCICTIPPQVLSKIPNNFSAQVKADLAVPVPTATGKIGLQYGRRWWEEDEQIYGGITNTNMDVSTIWYPSGDYMAKKGLVVGYYNFGANSNSYGALSPQGRRDRAVAQGQKIHGEIYGTDETSYSVDWLKTRYSEGGWVGWPGGQRSATNPNTAYGRLQEPDGNVYFAGDHMSWVIAWMHGALESSRKTVMDLHQRVAAS